MNLLNLTLNQPLEPKIGQELFQDKRVIVFGLPGAFTPTCSTKQLPRFEEMYDQFMENMNIFFERKSNVCKYVTHITTN